MNSRTTPTPQFYLTAPSPCPYLANQTERKVFTHLVGPRAPEMNDLLTQGGFRRSQNIAYRPACESCQACVSIRILADHFMPTKSMKRIKALNADIVAVTQSSDPTPEQFALFRKYIDHRHLNGGMSDMTSLDYAMMVEDTHVNSRVVEYRLRQPGYGTDNSLVGELIGAALTDVMSDGLSMVYSFFDPDQSHRSMGTFMILDHIARTRQMGMPHTYLGYWVNGSSKMNYKVRFLPQEHLTSAGWTYFGTFSEED
jgi:arginyl-tRNA--protein-N-Asp/Glu arginylyltransferase